jgi:hypothetical protein
MLKKPEACTGEDQFSILRLRTREFYEIKYTNAI